MKMLTAHTDIHEAAFAGDYRLLKKLLESNRQAIDKTNEHGQTALHRAAMAGWLPCVKLLVEKGANPNITDIAGCTPLHYASSNGYVEIAQHLVEEAEAKVELRSNKGYNPQSMAKARGQIRIMAFFDEIQNKMKGNTWLT